MNIFLRYEDFCGYFFFWVITKLAGLRVISMRFRVFFQGQGTELGYFLGVLENPDIFWG